MSKDEDEEEYIKQNFELVPPRSTEQLAADFRARQQAPALLAEDIRLKQRLAQAEVPLGQFAGGLESGDTLQVIGLRLLMREVLKFLG